MSQYQYMNRNTKIRVDLNRVPAFRKRRKVLHVDTGIIYDCLSDCCEALKVSSCYIINRMDYKVDFDKSYNFKYLD